MRVWIFIDIVDKFSSTRQTLGAQTPKKCCHVDVLEAVVCYPLARSVKAIGQADKLLISTNQITRILCQLALRP
jgi:hypothetical protein